MSTKDFLSVKAEEDDNTVIIEDSEIEDTKDGVVTQGCVSVEQNTQVNCDDQYVTQLAYENEDVLDMGEAVRSQMNLSTSRKRLDHNPEQVEFVYLRKRRRLASSPEGMKSKEPECEDGGVIYEYDDYECGSVVSEVSYPGDQQNTLMEVLNYCQAMYDAIQKLDKKFDSLHRKVSEMQHTRLKPIVFKPRPVGFTYRSSSNLSSGKIRLQKSTERESGLQVSSPGHLHHSPRVKVRLRRPHVQASSAVTTVPHVHQLQLQHPVHRQSPPLPTIVSTHSLCPPFNVDSEMPDLPSQASLATTIHESSANLAVASPVVSSAMPTPPSTSLEINNTTMTYKNSLGRTNIRNELPSSSSSVSINPATASSHSLHLPFSTASEMPDLPSQARLATTVVDSPVHVASSPAPSQMVSSVMPPETSLGENSRMITSRTPSGNTSISNEMPSSSINSSFEFVGDPKRNVKVPGNYLMKAQQKARPKYAARYLVRVLFPKETLLCSVMGTRTRGHRTLDSNKVDAIRGEVCQIPGGHPPCRRFLSPEHLAEEVRVQIPEGLCYSTVEFLATHFPNYDLSEHGRDWKTCITNVNAMIRCLRYETKPNRVTTEGKEKLPDVPDTSLCIDLVDNGEESKVKSQATVKMTSSSSNQHSSWGDNMPEVLHPPSSSKPSSLEPMAPLGNLSRNVQLPFSVIFVAKAKSRPELSARYLIRHLFTEDVLVKSNVYGNLDRGTHALDSTKIGALRDFLQENYPSFDLKPTGYDWKACVAAINSTIRSLRYDHKKASAGVRKKVLAESLPLSLRSKK